MDDDLTYAKVERCARRIPGLVLLKNPERTGQFPLVVVRMPCPGSDF